MTELPEKAFYSPEEVADYFGNITADTIRALSDMLSSPSGGVSLSRRWGERSRGGWMLAGAGPRLLSDAL